MPNIEIVEADLDNPIHAARILEIINQYAAEPGGGGKTLPPEIQRVLISRLKEQTNRLVLLAMQGRKPVGMAVCFRGFSTFAAKPLINIHDLAVMPDCRGLGAGSKLIGRVVEIAQHEGCCRVTLEVISDNAAARRLYQRCGFEDPTHGDGQTLSLYRPLDQGSNA